MLPSTARSRTDSAAHASRQSAIFESAETSSAGVPAQEENAMTRYVVQFELPVDNPAMKVSKRVANNVITFFVPLNHPDAHNMGFQDLVAATELSGLHKVSPAPNTDKKSSKEGK